MRASRIPAALLLITFLGFTQALAQTSSQAGRYDNGKMWTFEYPPLEYLAETYDLHPDDAWFERARLSVLRIPGCSASFVSPQGLVITNHHCVRSAVSRVTGEGEALLDDGFYATSRAEERPIPGYYADQLIAIEDVTALMEEASVGETAAERAQARADATERIEQGLRDQHGDQDLVVQVIGLYNGGRYSAYVFRRYSDVRLVMAVELQAGFFGGDGDNFTYPRYALDYAFLRLYDAEGQPLASPHHFSLSGRGVSENDLIFVIGNPGSTARQATVSQLEFLRDVMVEHSLRFLENRLADFRAFYNEDPETGEQLGIRNLAFSLSNSQKAYSGRLDALRDPVILERRADAERSFRDAILADPQLAETYGRLHDDLAEVQSAKRELGPAYGAFRSMESSRYASATLRRALALQRLLNAMDAGAQEAVEDNRESLARISDHSGSLENRLLASRMEEFKHYLGDDDPLVILLGESAEDFLGSTGFATEEGTQELLATLDAGAMREDPLFAVAAELTPRLADYNSAWTGLSAREDELQADVGRARFAVYGVSVPPDATFSPRFTDGVVKGYAYNGTLAPYQTTLYGLLDHYHSYDGHPDWTLPERWQNLSPEVDLSTPLNFISTSDTIGGNSGSPAVTPELEIVGLNFDRNIEGLSRDYIYLPERGRNIMVDVRAVLETLDNVYDADRIVFELKTGEALETEAEADLRSGG